MTVEYDDRQIYGVRKLVCECGNIGIDEGVMPVDEYIVDETD